jgi:hypothetical protein
MYKNQSHRQMTGINSTRSSRQQSSSWLVRAEAGAGGGSSGGGKIVLPSIESQSNRKALFLASAYTASCSCAHACIP